MRIRGMISAVFLLSAVGLVLLQMNTEATGSELAEEAGPPLPTDGEQIEVSGDDGDPIICADGKPLLYRVGDSPPAGLTSLRQLSHQEAVARDLTDDIEVVPGSKPVIVEVVEAAVPRCGPKGGGPSSEPVWVPETVGARGDEAPQRYVDKQSESQK